LLKQLVNLSVKNPKTLSGIETRATTGGATPTGKSFQAIDELSCSIGPEKT